MKRSYFFYFIVVCSLCLSEFGQAQPPSEANKLARQGAESAKDQNWDDAITSLRKATDLDKKYAPNLAAAYQQRGFAAANEKRYPDAIADFSEALKVKADASTYERRAAVEMKINELDKALADYTEAIKLESHEVKYYNYRAYIYELQGNLKDAMADTEKVLKMDKKNAKALENKARIEKRMQIQQGNQPQTQASPAATPEQAAQTSTKKKRK
jgi:tetratricopeptide (TPR) repeat protein